jgi:hypothetical protein
MSDRARPSPVARRPSPVALALVAASAFAAMLDVTMNAAASAREAATGRRLMNGNQGLYSLGSRPGPCSRG